MIVLSKPSWTSHGHGRADGPWWGGAGMDHQPQQRSAGLSRQRAPTSPRERTIRRITNAPRAEERRSVSPDLRGMPSTHPAPAGVPVQPNLGGERSEAMLGLHRARGMVQVHLENELSRGRGAHAKHGDSCETVP